ncbi:MAG: hypothetical protein MUD01_26120 [Chloroflexaceae bacterium]|nr:hypothetical protein [Chloroflexaceae bacterium]
MKRETYSVNLTNHHSSLVTRHSSLVTRPAPVVGLPSPVSRQALVTRQWP